MEAELKTKIKSYLKESELELALDALEKLYEEPHPKYAGVLNLYQRWNILLKNKDSGVLTMEQEIAERSKLTVAIQELLSRQTEHLDTEQPIQENVESLKKALDEANESNRKSTRAAGFYFVIIVFAILSYLFFKYLKF